jgi:eukaryotic-like serine/threonine-protein kinase
MTIGTLAGGRYELRSVLGTGAFSTVYDAYDRRLDAPVAVKVLAENHSLDPDLRERFVAEGHLLRRIGEPFVVGVYDLGETERARPYLVLARADRGDLAARSRSRRRQGYELTPTDVELVIDVVGAALEALHEARVVHRDLSPRNLLIRSVRPGRGGPGRSSAPSSLIADDERLVLSDLGLAKDLAAASGLTVGAGTAGFTPPEQRGGGRPIAERADLWAASALVVWLLLGRPPDDGGTWAQTVSDEWSPALAKALRRSLDDDPDQRHPSPTVWRDDVRAALSRPMPPLAAPDRSEPMLTGRRRRRRWVAIAAMVAGVAAAGAGTYAAVNAFGGDRGPTVQRLADDAVRSSITRGGATVAVVGPVDLAVGQPATFVAETENVAEWLWVTPQGPRPGTSQLAVTPRSTGAATIRLIGVTPSGELIEVTHDIRVRS